MTPPSRFLSALAALLFLAVSAWVGAYAYSRADEPKTAALRRADFTQSAALDGIAVRSEQPLRFEWGDNPTAISSRRVCAGGELARRRDGSRICAAGSCIYFDSSDGYEFLCPELLEGLTVSSLEDILYMKPESKSDARLVADSVWYYAALVKSGELEAETGPCRVLFDGFSTPSDAFIVSVSAAEAGKRAVLLRLTEGGDGLLSLRRCGAKLIVAEHSGLLAPLEAIRFADNGDCFVRTLSVGSVEEQAAEIIYKGDSFALIRGDTLHEGSRVLLP